MQIISKIYNYSEHRGNNDKGFISVTQLIGANYKAKLALEGKERDESLIELSLKRSSSFGSALHSWAEKALKNEPNVLTEIYSEKEFEGITITGSCDILEWNGKQWELGDIKTGYGKNITDDKLKQWQLQMSLYRWMLTPKFDIADRAWIYFISQSNNFQDEIPIELYSFEKTQNYILDKLYAIENQETPDCNNNVSYNSCSYCDFICEFRK